MESAVFRVELQPDGIIFVERRNKHVPDKLLRQGMKELGDFAKQLRGQGKPVLILNHAISSSNTSNPLLIQLLQKTDFDRAAVYGQPKDVNERRNLMIRANGLDLKVIHVRTKEEALAWLHEVEK
jgi:hypothetical protein